MKIFNSYRFKLFLSLWIFGVILVAIYHLAGHSLALLTLHIDEIANFQLKNEVAHFVDLYKENNQVSYPNSRFLKSYPDISGIPNQLHGNISTLDIGYHYIESVNDSGKHQSYYVAVFDNPHRPDRFYLLYDYTLYKKEYVDFQVFKASKRLLLALAIVCVLGVFIGLYVSKRLTSPINALVLQVKKLDPGHLQPDFSKNYHNDEIGVLAKALENSMLQIREFIEREKNFTRDSSHELRTPVTIISGAVEVIRELPEYSNKSLSRPVKRIERSINNMEEIIEAFLWLAREHRPEVKGESCLVGNIVKNAVEENRYILAGKPVSIDVKIIANPEIAVPAGVFRIAIVNLLRNAFTYTSQGQVAIEVQAGYISITNSGIIAPPDQLASIKEPFQKGINSKGYGIGLAIVECLCNRFDFKLEIDSDKESFTMVKLALKR